MPRLPKSCWPALLALALLGARPDSAGAWSGAQHIQINKAAARAVPAEMAAFRDFARPMALPGIYPDLWKESDPAETPRHYFEPDRLPPGTDLNRLPRDPLEALRQFNLAPDILGVAPWTITNLLGQMTEAIRTNDWLWAARCGAAMSHYVADIHMPLHCTRNFNGDDTGQAGIHTRIESDMVKAFFRPDMIAPEPGTYIADPFSEIMGWIAHSASLAPGWLNADTIAKRSANGRFDTERYYYRLWELTGDTVIAQIEAAARDLAALWYTAWVDAGRPAIPEPFDELPVHSVHSGVGIEPPAEGGPVGARAAANATYDRIIWVVMGFVALIVIGSSLYRGAQARRAAGK